MASNDSNTDTNPALNRPVSPHLQVYKLPLTAWLSISHRASGIVSSVGACLLVFVLAKAAGGPESFSGAYGLLSSWFGYLVLFGFTLALFFHFCNGIRHLFWDIGIGFELETADKSARFALIAAGVLTVLTWIVAFAAG